MTDQEQPTGQFKLWTITGVAEATGISRRTLQRMIKAGKIKTSPLCKVVRIPNEEVLRLANGG